MKLNTSSPYPMRLDGSLLVSEADRCKTLLELRKPESTTIEIDMTEVSAADAIGLQLLISAAKTASSLGISFSLLNVPEPVVMASEAIGLDLSTLSTTHSHSS